MSSLKNLKNPTPTLAVAVSDEESFTVRGVSLSDVLHIYYRHTGGISLAFERLAMTYKSAGLVEQDDVTSMLAGAIADVPTVVAEIIAIASGADTHDDAEFQSDVDIASSLSMGVKLSALEKIGHLTFTSEMPPKKFIALIASALNQTRATPGETEA